MKIGEMYHSNRTPIIDAEGRPLVGVSLNAKEEEEIAKTVFSLLRQRAFQGNDRDFLEELYWNHRCRKVAIISADDFSTTIDIINSWADRDWFPVHIPAFMNKDFEPDNSSLFNDLRNLSLEDPTDSLYPYTHLLLIWQYEWEKARDDLVKISDIYQTFSGSEVFQRQAYLRRPDSQIERALTFEAAFWEEVEEVEKLKGFNRHDAYDYVRDYMKRGRDVIPRVLSMHWREQEMMFADEVNNWIHWVQEDWFLRDIEYSEKQAKFLSKAPKHAN